MATSYNGRYTGGFRMSPEDAANFKRGMEDALREKCPHPYMDAYASMENEVPGSNNDEKRKKVDPKTGRPFKNLNHPIPPRKEPLHNQVVIHQADYAYPVGTYHATLPRRGRLGDTRIADESGRPLNIGPSASGPSEFGTVDAALNHFRQVSRGFDKLNGYVS